MVPNSLGPGELLTHYGTDEQKEKYLPGLANGDYVPCFGLTGPYNGSDAAGPIDQGIVKLNNEGKRVIEVSINKRYITLAPIANCIGLEVNSGATSFKLVTLTVKSLVCEKIPSVTVTRTL